MTEQRPTTTDPADATSEGAPVGTAKARRPSGLRTTEKSPRKAAAKPATRTTTKTTAKKATTTKAASKKPATRARTPKAVAIAVGPGTEPIVTSRTTIGAAMTGALDLSQGAIGRVDAQDVAISKAAVGMARGEKVSVEMGAVGAVFGDEIRVTQAGVGNTLGRSVTLEQAVVRTVIAQDVIVRRPSAIGFLIARRVEGDVRALLDWRAALAFGAAFGVIAGLLRRRR